MNFLKETPFVALKPYSELLNTFVDISADNDFEVLNFLNLHSHVYVVVLSVFVHLYILFVNQIAIRISCRMILLTSIRLPSLTELFKRL